MRKLLAVLMLLLLPSGAWAEITFDANGKWESSFTYSSECSQRGLDGKTSCDHVQNDGIQWAWGGGIGLGDTYTQAVAAANYPGGEGGLGARFWNYDGRNELSGPIKVAFPSPQKELWIRWYMRYQEGFGWKDHVIDYNKTLYIRTNVPHNAVIPSLVTNRFRISTQVPSWNHYADVPSGWNQTYGPEYSDGSWHCFEIYIKMDTQDNPYNSIYRMWLNGELIGEKTNVNFSDNNATAREGWVYFDFNNNQNEVDNSSGPLGVPYAYIDYDDMVIYNQTPPNTDAHGNDFIGPLTWDAPEPSCVTTYTLCTAQGECESNGWYWNADSQVCQLSAPYTPASRATIVPVGTPGSKPLTFTPLDTPGAGRMRVQ
jgi:hypothetical protein